MHEVIIMDRKWVNKERGRKRKIEREIERDRERNR